MALPQIIHIRPGGWPEIGILRCKVGAHVVDRHIDMAGLAQDGYLEQQLAFAAATPRTQIIDGGMLLPLNLLYTRKTVGEV